MTVDVAAQFEQARVLLAYAARIGRVVDPAVRSELIRLERATAGGSATFTEEQSLNDQVTALVALVAPAGLEAARASLLATDLSDRGRRSGSATATCLNVFGIVLTIFIMSLTTAYTMITSDIQDLRPDGTKYLQAIEAVYSGSQPRPGAADTAKGDDELANQIEKVRELDGSMSSAVHSLRSMVQIEGNGLNWCVITFQMFWDSSSCFPLPAAVPAGRPLQGAPVLDAYFTPSWARISGDRGQ